MKINKNDVAAIVHAINENYRENGPMRIGKIRKKLLEQWPDITSSNIKLILTKTNLFKVSEGCLPYDDELVNNIRKFATPDRRWTPLSIVKCLRAHGVNTPCVQTTTFFLKKYNIDLNECLVMAVTKLHRSRPAGGWSRCEFINQMMTDFDVTKSMVVGLMRGLRFNRRERAAKVAINELIKLGKLTDVDELRIEDVRQRLIKFGYNFNYNALRISVNELRLRKPKKRRHFKVNLSETDVRMLTEIVDSRARCARRAQLALMFNNGATNAQVIAATGYSAPSVHKYKVWLAMHDMDKLLSNGRL